MLDPCAVSAYWIILWQTRWSYYEWSDLQQGLSAYETCQSIIFESMCKNECQGAEYSTRELAELSWRHDALASDLCAVSAVATISTSESWYYASVQGLYIRVNHLHALNFLGADHCCIRELEYLTSINTCISICILTIYRLHYRKCLGAQYKIRELPDIAANFCSHHKLFHLHVN